VGDILRVLGFTLRANEAYLARCAETESYLEGKMKYEA